MASTRRRFFVAVGAAATAVPTASNAAVSRARTVVASNVDVILVDAKSGRTARRNALAVAFGANTRSGFTGQTPSKLVRQTKRPEHV